MKRILDKVKDIVEVRPFRTIRDFTADPADTLSSYRFTDATADLMAKWLDGVSAVHPGSGAAYALAGYRGVGKSHFLATLGALAASPDLRGSVSESHVAFSAQRLQRRHFPVSNLRRGTHATLLDELKAAVSQSLNADGVDSLTSFEQVIKAALGKIGDTPWILLIDTALERGSRVTRDDGADLSTIADLARGCNIFVGVALDDDIASADGSNAAIVRSFSIDYLDQSHLYKVVNAHVFPKEAAKQAALHDIYGYFREVLPSFRWSEQKFSSLYPLHPSILEVAPYVRLYVHDFALLGFASEAGERILGRPANSLIALDEVYDNAESGLRKIDELQEAFTAYDVLNSTVVNKIPVMQRLQAKLILKALLLLSLDGQGATASEVCASELIFDESDPGKAIKTVEELLLTFADALPDDFRVTSEEDGEPRYGFKVTSKENLNNAVTQAVSKVPADAVPAIIRKVFQDRFPETAAASESSSSEDVIQASLLWRGTVRRGRIRWTPSGVDARVGDEWTDWQVQLDFDGTAFSDKDENRTARVIWRPDALRPDEVDRLRSYHVLNSNSDLREKYSEQIRAAVHSHSIAAEKILTRSLLEDGILVIDGFDYNFTEDARDAQSLSEIFSIMLEPLFETRYPAHPYFTRTLEYDDVASIVTDLYNGTRRDLADVQSRAQTFAFPLGLVRLEGTSFVPESRERLAALPYSSELLGLVEKDKQVSLDALYDHFRRPPYGLGRESQQMLMTALVAERYIEFVTKSGNRINRRSLDLRIIWDDITGVSRPLESSTTGENLRRWAKLFLGNTPFESLDRQADRDALTDAFTNWTDAWADARLLERFSELPDEELNVRIWQVAARVSKTFGAIVPRVRSASAGEMALEECLEGIAEAFSGSETEFRERESDLEVLGSFVRGATLRETVRTFLAVSEATEAVEVETSRERLTKLLKAGSTHPSEEVNRELGYSWEKFRRAYAGLFEERHAVVMNSPLLRAKVAEIMKSLEWGEFDVLAKLPEFDRKIADAIEGMGKQITQLECSADVGALLQFQPYCSCAFAMNLSSDADQLPSALHDAVLKGLAAFRSVLSKNSDDIIGRIENFSESSGEREVQAACRELISVLRSGKEIPRFTDLQLKIIITALDSSEGRFSQLNAAANVGTRSTVSAAARPTPAEAADEAFLLNV